MKHGEKAVELFVEGYNCAQAVLLAFSDMTGLEDSFAAKMISSFGGGIGRLREVCGAVSGMAAVAGILYGYDSPTDDTAKMKHYELVQQLAAAFRQQAGSIICRELLENPSSDPAPSPRTAQYYAERPCARLVYLAASVLDDYIAENPVEK